MDNKKSLIEHIKFVKEKYSKSFSNKRKDPVDVRNKLPNPLPIRISEDFVKAGVKYNPHHRFRYILFEDLTDNGISTPIAKKYRIDMKKILPLEKLTLYIPPDASSSYHRHVANRARRVICNKLLGFAIDILQEELIKTLDTISIRTGRTEGLMAACKYKHRTNDTFDLTIGTTFASGKSLVLYNQTRSTKNWKRDHLHNLSAYPFIQPKSHFK